MAKGKDARVTVILECSNCLRNGLNKESRGISRYITQNNRHNTPRPKFRYGPILTGNRYQDSRIHPQ